ncbi:MAG TPA: thiol:disulfide interchange protein DsbA/DsbL [Luteimonas sp.]|nr:thiol:disulfide interchange protein DsbA/DsbL [Luteimonas sp.]
MNQRRQFLVPLVLSALLAACAQEAPTPAADTAQAPAAATETVAGEPALDPAAAAAAAAAPAGATAPPAVDATAEAAVAAAAQAAASGPGPVAGTDYVEIQGGQPYAPLDGKVEVAEVFAYWCAHCAQFDPLVGAWKARLPADVRFSYVPAVFSEQDNFPRAFYAAETAGALERVHAPLFKAIHIDRSLRQNASVDDIATFLGTQGIDAAGIKSTMQSFAINAKLNRAKQFAIRSGIEATPTLVINGKYRVRGSSHEDQLRIADQLIARERAAQAGGAQ